MLLSCACPINHRPWRSTAMPADPPSDAPFYVVLNAGSGRAETDLRCTTIRAVLGAAGRSCELEVVHDAAKLEDAARV
ncbi:hypothetical protein ACEN88_28720, partial [Massilia sp. CT11-108]